jgi:hypothetical protein
MHGISNSYIAFSPKASRLYKFFLQSHDRIKNTLVFKAFFHKKPWRIDPVFLELNLPRGLQGGTPCVPKKLALFQKQENFYIVDEAASAP